MTLYSWIFIGNCMFISDAPAPPPPAPRLHYPSPSSLKDLVVASITWLNTSAEQARQLALDGAHSEVERLLQAPKSELTMDRIYIGEYHQGELEVAVDFHLGNKVRTRFCSSFTGAFFQGAWSLLPLLFVAAVCSRQSPG